MAFQQVTSFGSFGSAIPLSFYGVPFMNALSFTLPLAGPVNTQFLPPLPSQQCQATDGGVAIVVQAVDSTGNPVNLRNATKLTIITRSPSGITIETPATYYTNGFDGQMSFNTGVGTPFGAGLNEYGIWSIQGKFFISGNVQFTTIGLFFVGSNLGA